MANAPTTTFNLPNTQPVDVYLVRLPDGRVVARTADELAPLPTTGPVPSAPRPPQP